MRRLKRDMLSTRYALPEAQCFDWISTCGINPVDKKFDGAHSHVAISARERGIPAATSVGETLFTTIAITKRVTVVPEDGERRDCLGPAWPRFVLA
jgi:hypothetical protein